MGVLAAMDKNTPPFSAAFTDIWSFVFLGLLEERGPSLPSSQRHGSGFKLNIHLGEITTTTDCVTHSLLCTSLLFSIQDH